MRFGTRLAGAKLTFLSRLSPTGGTPDRECLFIGDFHTYIMPISSIRNWSILTLRSNENRVLKAENNAQCCQICERRGVCSGLSPATVAFPHARCPSRRVLRLRARRRWDDVQRWHARRLDTLAMTGAKFEIFMSVRLCGTLQAFDLRCSRKASADDVILTMQRPCTCSFMTSPRSFASSQTGSRGHDVCHASITSS